MKRNKIYLLFTLTIGIVLMALIGCTEDSNELTEQKRKVQIVPAMGTAQTVKVTRSADDQRFGDYIEADAYPVGTQIGIAMYNLTAKKLHDTDNTQPEPEPLVESFIGKFTYKGIYDKNGNLNNPKWGSTVFVDPSTEYKVFGHVPADCSESFVYNFSDSKQTKDSKEYPANSITLMNIKPVSNTDVSVVVGVGKNHFYDTLLDGITPDRNSPNLVDYKDASGNTIKTDYSGAYPCNFTYMTSDGQQEDPDKIYLLMDHIFVQTRFFFAIGKNYHKLRDIRIKKIELSAPDIYQLNATISLNTNADHYDKNNPTVIPNEKTAIPATNGIDWTLVKYGDEGAPTAPASTDTPVSAEIYNCTKIDEPTGWESGTLTTFAKTEEGKKAARKDEIDNGYQLVEVEDPTDDDDWVLVAPGFFTPVKAYEKPVKFVLKTAYDVLDKKGQVTRSATSAVNIYESTKNENIVQGTYFNIHVTVEPTYLYQLSDNDLDNPTLKIE